MCESKDCHCNKTTDENASYNLLITQWNGLLVSETDKYTKFEVSISEENWNSSKFIIYDVTKPQGNRITQFGFKYLDSDNLLQPIPNSVSKLMITIMNQRIEKKIKQAITNVDFNVDNNKTLIIPLGELFYSNEIDDLISIIGKENPAYTYGNKKFLTSVVLLKNSGVRADGACYNGTLSWFEPWCW